MSVSAAFLRGQIEWHCSQIVAVAEKIPAGLAPLRPIGRKGASFMASIYKRGKVQFRLKHYSVSRPTDHQAILLQRLGLRLPRNLPLTDKKLKAM